MRGSSAAKNNAGAPSTRSRWIVGRACFASWRRRAVVRRSFRSRTRRRSLRWTRSRNRFAAPTPSDSLRPSTHVTAASIRCVRVRAPRRTHGRGRTRAGYVAGNGCRHTLNEPSRPAYGSLTFTPVRPAFIETLHQPLPRVESPGAAIRRRLFSRIAMAALRRCVVAACGSSAPTIGTVSTPTTPSSVATPPAPTPTSRTIVNRHHGSLDRHGSDSFSPELVTLVVNQSGSAITGTAELNAVNPTDGSVRLVSQSKAWVVPAPSPAMR